MKQLEAVVRGRVQGVSFRHYTRLEAQRLGLKGWVANQPDGAVRVVAQGNDPALETLVHYLHRGPALARVESVETHWTDAAEVFSSFSIRWL